MATTELELWACVDASGDYGLGRDADEAKAAYENDIGQLADAEGFRCFKITLTVPLPEPVELTGSVPAEERQPVLSVA